MNCLLVGAVALHLAGGSFTLEWTHSVEKQRWRETWAVAEDGLHLVEAAVKGSGAGMDPGEGARLQNGWWVWRPLVAPVPELILASSGATGGGWTLCADGSCQDIGLSAAKGIRLAPCEG